jgi:tRNA1(Val) A37 N6-methylase TrmN6
MSAVTDDSLLGGRVRLLQPERGHRVGTDAVLLAAAAPLGEGDCVIDVGAGTGAVGLMLAARAPVQLTLVEKDPGLADLAARNLALNGRAGSVAVADVLDRASLAAAGLAVEGADLIVTNPPFTEAGEGRSSPDPARAAAHVLPAGGLDLWLAACASLLRPGGHLVLVQRADRLAACLQSLARSFGGMRLRFVHPRRDEPAIRLLLVARKGSRAPLAVLPPLILHEPGGAFTPEAAALHRGEIIAT